MLGPEIAELAKTQIMQLTGFEYDTLSGLRHEADGWHITVELVELKRIPTSADILGSYDVVTDAEGQLLSYQRTRRYCRSELVGV